MKKIVQLYIKGFFISMMITLLLEVFIVRHFNLTYGAIEVTIGAMIMAIFIAAAKWMFSLEKGNSWVNTTVGFIILLPILGVIRRLFGVLVFRYTFILYAFGFVILIIYLILLAIVHHKVKKETDALNKMIEKKEQ